jgi:hypothetical protein
MVITSGSFALDLMPGINKHYGDAYKEYPIEYTNIFATESSTRAFERDVQTTGFGLASIMPEGEGVSYDTANQGFNKDYTHVQYGLGFIITRIMVEDDQYERVSKTRAQSLAFSIRQTKEILGANILNRAFNSSYTGGDGVELCATTHPNGGGAGGTQQNELTAAADLSEAALEQAYIDIGNWENDRGLRISIQPRRLIIPINLKFDADRILKSNQRVDTADNDINALRAANVFPEGAYVNHYLTDTDAWFIITNCPNGLKYFEREAERFGVDNDFDTDNAKFKATFRCSFGWTDWRGCFGSPGA